MNNPKQYYLLDTIFNYILYFGSPGKHLYLAEPDQIGSFPPEGLTEFRIQQVMAISEYIGSVWVKNWPQIFLMCFY